MMMRGRRKGGKAGLVPATCTVSQACMRAAALWGIAHADSPAGPYGWGIYRTVLYR